MLEWLGLRKGRWQGGLPWRCPNCSELVELVAPLLMTCPACHWWTERERIANLAVNELRRALWPPSDSARLRMWPTHTCLMLKRFRGLLGAPDGDEDADFVRHVVGRRDRKGVAER